MICLLKIVSKSSYHQFEPVLPLPSIPPRNTILAGSTCIIRCLAHDVIKTVAYNKIDAFLANRKKIGMNFS